MNAAGSDSQAPKTDGSPQMLRSKFGIMTPNKSKAKLVAKRWLSARLIRQQACIEVLQAGSKHLDENFFESLDTKRAACDQQFWKASVVQLTITGFLFLSFLDLKGVHFSIFGVSADALANAREFLLFCHALTVIFTIVLQQYISKLEDFLVAYARYHIGSDKPDDDELKIFMMRFISPIEAFNVMFLPYRKNLFYNSASKIILRVHNLTRAIAAIGFASFSILVPTIASILTWQSPNFGWLSYGVVGYWWAVGAFSVASALLNVFALP